jgi:class 3 adenylate cyclase
MGQRTYEIAFERVVRADPDLVWSILSDTNRLDRALGVSASTYTYKLIGEPPTRQRVGLASYKGARFRWIEVGEWEEGRSFWGERRFLYGLLTTVGVRCTIERVDGGSRVQLTAYSVPSRSVGALAALHWRRVFKKTLRRYLDELDTLFATTAPASDDSSPNVRVRQLLALAAPAQITHGRVAAVDREVLAVRAGKLDGIDAELAKRIVGFISDQPDDAVNAMRPFQLARTWQADPRETLRAFLHAARAGLVDLQWQLNCPVCRVGAGNASTLADVGKRVHCDECDISFELDFASNVEAIFVVNPAIRPVRREVYCAGTPFVRPHVFAQLVVEPGTERVIATRPAGPLLVRALGRQRQVHVEADACVTIEIGDDALTTRASDGELCVANRSGATATVLVERAGWTAELVRGSDLIALDEFHSLFGTEAPSAGIDLHVGTICVAFSDVVGSTAMYERLGDATAYALIQEHFRVAHEIVAACDGSIVKTLGDGIMMCFVRPEQAVAASLRLAAHARELGSKKSVDFAVRVGVHQGPCYVVRANDRLDLFGTSVNVAARLCRLAAPNQVVTSASLLEHESVHEVLARAQTTVQRRQSELKGFSAHYHVAAIDQPSPSVAGGNASVLRGPP